MPSRRRVGHQRTRSAIRAIARRAVPWPALLLIGTGTVAVASPAHAGISTFKVPGADKHPRGIVAGPDGALWFTDPYSIEIGRLTTEGAFSRYPLARSSAPAFPSKIVAGPDGALWFTEGGAEGDNTSDRIGRITTDGDIREFPVPTFKANVEGIASGPDGALWFTEKGASKIGRITTEGAITEFPLAVAVDAAGARVTASATLVRCGRPR